MLPSGKEPASEPVVSSQTPVTVRRVLELPAVRRGVPEVLAGREALGREVRWVHSGEVPNIASMLQGGELLLTTGMGIGAGAADQRRFVEELADHDVAAVVVELGASIERAPRALVDAAERRGLPLIALHREVRFVEITEAVHREIIDQGGELLRRGEALHRRFTELLLSGADVADVLTDLAGFLANPVVLERAGQGVAYHAPHESDDATVLGAWDSFARGLESAPPAIEVAVPMGEEGSWGRLAVLAIESPLGAGDRVALERAVGLIALALMRRREEEGLASRRRGDFLAGLPELRASEREIRRRAAELGFTADPAALLPVAAMRLPGPADDGGDTAAEWALARRDVQRELESQGLPLIAGVRGEDEDLLLILAVADPADRPRLVDLVAGAIATATGRHLGDPGRTVVCVGPLAETWLQAGAAIGATVDALPAAAHGDRRPWHDVAKADVDRLLWTLREQPALRRFAELRLRPLLDRDTTSRAPLLETLVAFYRHGGRKAETARALHIERQTLYHRLARIEETLGVDLADADTALALHLALRANRYLELS